MVPTTAPNLGFLLAKAAQRWNELLAARFASAGYAEVRPAHGSVLMPLFAEPAQRIGELTRQARVSKQTMTSLLVQIERDGLIERVRDPHDGRSTIVVLSARGRRFQLVAEEILADLDALVAEAVTPDALATTRTTLKELVLCLGSGLHI